MEMERITLPKFDHKSDDLEGSLGLSNKEAHYVRNAIIFECLACPIIADEFFNKGEAPDNLMTMPGVLERVFPHLRNHTEEIYCLMVFTDGYYEIQEVVEKTAKDIDSKKIKPIPDEIETLVSNITGKQSINIANAIDRVKKSNFDFDIFVKLMMKEEDYDASGKFIPNVDAIDQSQVGDFLKKMLLEALRAKEAAKKAKEDEDKKKKDNQ